MRRGHFESLAPICPVCQAAGRESAVELAEVFEEEGEHVIEGLLRCRNSDCQSEFPIIDGIPILVPRVREFVAREISQIAARADLTAELESLIGDCAGPGSSFDATRQQLSSYGWDHWGDLDSGEPAAAREGEGPGSAPRLAVTALERAGDLPAGPCLEVGCSAGRVACILAERSSGPVLGIDLNFAMLQVAARMLRTGRVRYPRRKIGLVYERREYPVDPPARQQVDYWACDGTALPFRDATFGGVLALNTLDSVAEPLELLRSIHSSLRSGGKSVIACPYDWSPGATPVEAWLGGHSQRGDTQGDPATTLRALLTPGAHPAAIDGVRIVAEGEGIPWRVRLHDRGAVDYRTHLIVAQKAETPE